MFSTIPIKQLVIIQDEGKSMYETLFSMACAYAHSGNLIEEHTYKQELIDYIFPSVVCNTFAIELFLKFYLIVDNSKAITGKDIKDIKKIKHDYSLLWNKIQPHYQEEIIRYYNINNNTQYTERAFRQSLIDIGDKAFTKWRYMHEFEDFMTVLEIEKIKKILNALGESAQSIMNKKIDPKITHDS
jgi:hypothetical protein